MLPLGVWSCDLSCEACASEHSDEEVPPGQSEESS